MKEPDVKSLDNYNFSPWWSDIDYKQLPQNTKIGDPGKNWETQPRLAVVTTHTIIAVMVHCYLGFNGLTHPEPGSKIGIFTCVLCGNFIYNKDFYQK